MTSEKSLEIAERFVRYNLPILCEELLEWDETGMLPVEARFWKLSDLCEFADNKCSDVARSLIRHRALEFVVSKSKELDSYTDHDCMLAFFDAMRSDTQPGKDDIIRRIGSWETEDVKSAKQRLNNGDYCLDDMLLERGWSHMRLYTMVQYGRKFLESQK